MLRSPEDEPTFVWFCTNVCLCVSDAQSVLKVIFRRKLTLGEVGRMLTDSQHLQGGL